MREALRKADEAIILLSNNWGRCWEIYPRENVFFSHFNCGCSLAEICPWVECLLMKIASINRNNN